MSASTSQGPLLSADSEACRDLVERVLQSRELRRSLRLQDLLRYIGKRALHGHAGTLREQEIGAQVFGRPDEYDTAVDNIVRVNVSELRKRLARYFQEEGAAETIVMEIPRGGYLPIFSTRSLPLDLLEETPPREKQPGPSALPFAGEPGDSLTSSRPGPLQASLTPKVTRRRTVVWLPIGLLLALVAALGACAWLTLQNQRLRNQIEPWRSDPVLAALWSEFLAPSQNEGEDVDIVTADASFALAEDLLGRPIALDDYLDYQYKNLADQPGLSPETRTALRLILDRNNGSIGDFQAAKLFMDLGAHAPAIKLASARSYTPESIKTHNVILIGGRQSNPWVELYRDRMNFFMEYDPHTERSYVANRAPLPGEKAVYETLKDPRRGYSVVAFLPNLGEHHYALILSGTDSQATRAAGEFVTSSEGLAQIRQKMPFGPFPFFEVVLSSSRLVGTTLHSEIVAWRVHRR